MSEKLDLDAIYKEAIANKHQTWAAYPPTTVCKLIDIIRELESRAEISSMLLREQTDKTCAANLRVLELESASQPGGGEAVAKIVGVDEYGPQLQWSKHWVELNGRTLYVKDEQ